MLVEFESCLRFNTEAKCDQGWEEKWPGAQKSGRVKRLLLGRGILSSPANGMYSMWKEREPGIKSLQESSLGGGIQGCLSRTGFYGRGTLP